MRFLFYFTFLLIVAGCKESALEKKLSVTDILIVQFYNEEGLIEKAVTTTVKPAIQKLVHFLNGSPAKTFDCVFDGKLIFLSGGNEIQQVGFKFDQNNCRYFSILMKDTVINTTMSNEAADFMSSLERGEGHY
jgi:hypothetical protein